LVDDYRPGGLVLNLSENGYDEADQEAINEHLLDAYDLADHNRSHLDPEVAELAGGFVDDIAELEDADGPVPTREALTAAGIFVLGTGVDAGHLDPIG
jgi:hypothetical protein